MTSYTKNKPHHFVVAPQEQNRTEHEPTEHEPHHLWRPGKGPPISVTASPFAGSIFSTVSANLEMTVDGSVVRKDRAPNHPPYSLLQSSTVVPWRGRGAQARVYALRDGVDAAVDCAEHAAVPLPIARQLGPRQTVTPEW